MKPPAYPLEMDAAAGAFVNGRARICGGFNTDLGDMSACYEYKPGDDLWTLSNYSLSEDREHHASLMDMSTVVLVDHVKFSGELRIVKWLMADRGWVALGLHHRHLQQWSHGKGAG